ncbi:multidrug effflux MFS transporter [Pseudoroseicyclus tamaricis]|uniref:Bcr/CflA family efflux transporter n=1 Tax=Pseudoroseicyclus tamaricis TaxID=2705421 RepID=A0A6B2JWH8_9RHOB|nr:multidrug effflux MFS transporter [Pseudoroseicyclus tamaricis]NDV01009.1 multidrug effflux MFS transporter [Pseudoroseicyclus tamaricis]
MTATAPADAPTGPPAIRFLDRRTPPHILTLTLIASMSALSMSIFLPSLAAMARYFGADYAVMQLAVSAYLASTAFVQLFVGPLSDRFGRRPVVLGALIVFVLATIGCALAPTTGIFLAFRMLQACVAACMALSRAIVRDMVPAEQAASMLGYVTMGMALVPMIAPTIGGVIDEVLGWRAVFWFLCLFATGIIALCWADQGETLAGGRGLSLRAQVKNYPELLQSRRFWGYVICAAAGSGSFFALLGGASYVASALFGLSPMMTGIAVGSPAIGYALGNFLTGRYAVRAGINAMCLAGTLTSTIGLSAALVAALIFEPSPLLFFGFMPLLGLGNGMMMPSATAGSLSVRPELAGTASGLGMAIAIGGGAVLSALAGSLLSGSGSPLPLQWIMAGSSAVSLIAILMVIRRERSLAVA